MRCYNLAVMQDRIYTPSQANAVLPRVRLLVGRMLGARNRVVEMQGEIWPAVEAAVFNGGGKSAASATREIIAIQDVIAQLQALNILVKDINTGLIDFPAERDGRVVLLCWQYDEPSVQFWHEVDAGFGGRQRIDDGF